MSQAELLARFEFATSVNVSVTGADADRLSPQVAGDKWADGAQHTHQTSRIQFHLDCFLLQDNRAAVPRRAAQVLIANLGSSLLVNNARILFIYPAFLC